MHLNEENNSTHCTGTEKVQNSRNWFKSTLIINAASCKVQTDFAGSPGRLRNRMKREFGDEKVLKHSS
jgi:hypothetical protein